MRENSEGQTLMTVSESTRESPGCATAVLLDNSGSMYYGQLYINVRRVGLALDDLIRREYPGDWLSFIQVHTFAKVLKAGELASFTAKKVVLYEPVVRLKADMNDKRVIRSQIPQQFTNIQHGRELARKLLAHQDTPKRQIILITDGLPTAHFEGQYLYLLYPPNARTTEATLREGELCRREGITINTILLQTWWQSSEDAKFVQKLSESADGRVFFTANSNEMDCSEVCENFNRWREL